MSVRMVIAVLALGYILFRLRGISTGGFIDFFRQLGASHSNLVLFIPILILMTVNWGIEAWKWMLLVSGSEKIGFPTAYKAILGGVTSSIFTPNRIGEFIGRVFVLKKTEPLTGIMYTLVGSYAQLLTTLLAGTVAFSYTAPRFLKQYFPANEWTIPATILSLDIAALLFTALFFNIRLLSGAGKIIPVKYLPHLSESIRIFEMFSDKDLFKVLLLSIGRYLVFTTQFFLSLLLCGLDVDVFQAFTIIPVIYLVLAAVPTVALTELGIRGSVSIFLFGMISSGGQLSPADALAVLTASALIWIINIALPAIAGLWVVLRLKFFGR